MGRRVRKVAQMPSEPRNSSLPLNFLPGSNGREGNGTDGTEVRGRSGGRGGSEGLKK